MVEELSPAILEQLTSAYAAGLLRCIGPGAPVDARVVEKPAAPGS